MSVFQLMRRRVGLPYVLDTCARSVSSVHPEKNIKIEPYVVQPPVTMETPSGNMAAYVLQNARRWHDKVAIECSETSRHYTYGQMVDHIARFGTVLKKMGVGRGDTVAIMMVNCPEYPIALLGAVSIGAVATVLNSQYTYEEVYTQLKDSKAKLVVADNLIWGTVSKALDLMDRPVSTILNFPSSSPTPSGHPNLLQLLDDKNIPFSDIVEVNDSDICFMPYSSGTTGNPKGVCISHKALLSGMVSFMHPQYHSHMETTASYQETYMCYLPFFHVYGLVPHISCGFHKGIKLLSIPKFDPNTFVSHITKEKVRVLHTVPTVLNFLMQSPQVTPTSMASVETTICGAAPVPPTAVKEFTEKIDRKIQFQEGYGMTEVLITHFTPLGSDRTGSTGMSLPNVQCKVLDLETDELLGPNQIGEICLKSPAMMNCYFNNAKATNETMTEDGWVRSGDVGYFNEEEYLSIVDRTKELVKVKALQVSPSELENILLQHPKVAEVGVVGVPNEKLGEAPRAYVVAKSPATEAEIADFLASHVAPHKKLAGGVVFIKEIPKNATGKMMRRKLKEMSA